MKKLIILNKKEGETPLEALEAFRKKNNEYKDQPMTYAGRLDPMASGLLVILAGEEAKNKQKYLNLSKEYEFEVLFGFATDTYDILGKITEVARQDLVKREDLEKKIKIALKDFVGTYTQAYPAYSSKTVGGKPLFDYAKHGLSVDLPVHQVTVQSLKFLGLRSISRKKLLETIEKRIEKVNGDFRQKEIIRAWKKNLEQGESLLRIANFKIKCGSGTYVRSIAHGLGGGVGVPALAFSIKRTKIGRFAII